MNKGVWFVAGGAAGAYVVMRARRAAEALTYEGLHDRLSGLFVGARLFAEEVRAGAVEKEAELRERLDLMPARHDRQLEAAATLTLVVSSDDEDARLPDPRRGTHD